jgi:hypothetical protein
MNILRLMILSALGEEEEQVTMSMMGMEGFNSWNQNTLTSNGSLSNFKSFYNNGYNNQSFQMDSFLPTQQAITNFQARQFDSRSYVPVMQYLNGGPYQMIDLPSAFAPPLPYPQNIPIQAIDLNPLIANPQIQPMIDYNTMPWPNSNMLPSSYGQAPYPTMAGIPQALPGQAQPYPSNIGTGYPTTPQSSGPGIPCYNNLIPTCVPPQQTHRPIILMVPTPVPGPECATETTCTTSETDWTPMLLLSLLMAQESE